LYTYLRIIVESIATLTPSSSDPETNALQALPNARSFRVSKETLNIGLDPTVEKTAELGYSDIHLEVQGLWKPTLHYNLQGIPESLMTLIAQTTCLANEKAHLETRAGCDLRLSADLKHHIQTLEESIWAWSLPSELTTISTHKPAALLPDNQDLIHQPCAQSMVQAIHRALVIYFYRRIHDVSAMVLQDHVRQALENLERCIDKMVEDDDFAPSLAWAAYIAACEATTPDLQKRALKCLSISDRRGVSFTSKPSTEVVLSIWGERYHETTLSYKWTSLLQEIRV
jgi:arginine metabolism regulation protein II